MAARGSSSSAEAEAALQVVAQSTGWTYTLLWRLCQRQGALVWAGGHYNGAIRTRKTTGGGDAEEEGETTAALRRSRQLKELYDSLVAAAAADSGGGAQPPRRPTAAALAPEDLTETEWFYLMCASYCFPPAVGLPGEAFAREVHVWLCGANKVDSKVFSRAILARSAGIQTVACIPVDDGVLEIGTTEKVEEDIRLIQYARSIFMDQIGAPIIPTLSGYSISSPATHINHQPFQTEMGNCMGDIDVQKNCVYSGDEHNKEMEEDDDDRIGLETNAENDRSWHSQQDTDADNEQGTLNAGSSELMLIGTSERLRDGCSNQADEDIPVLMVCQNGNQVAQDEFCPWRHFLDEDLNSNYLQPPSAAEDQAVLAENAHYIKTVLSILGFNARRQAQEASNMKTYMALSKNSSYSRWNDHKGSSMLIPDSGTPPPQRMLKSILLGAPISSSHQSRHRGGDEAAQSSPEPRSRDDDNNHDDGEGMSRRRSQRGAPVQVAELSGSHGLKERRRREKLNERFVMLRSLVPFVTKMDRTSILGDTIEYVKQLRRRIQELESSRARQLVVDSRPTTMAQPPPPPALAQAAASTEKTGRRHRTSGGGGEVQVQVSIIESDALLELELRCPNREGLLVRVMQALQQELRLEVTAVQASSAGDVLHAELRAKVMKEVHGRRSSVSEVKSAIHLIVSSD